MAWWDFKWFNGTPDVEEARDVREFLDQADIPTPTSILADLLVLKINFLTAKSSEHRYYRDSSYIELNTSTGRKIEIWMSLNGNGHGSLRVGMPGAPVYRSVHFSGKECTSVIDAVVALRERYKAQIRADAAAQSQHDALDIIEHML
jgi:hypothetical protein